MCVCVCVCVSLYIYILFIHLYFGVDISISHVCILMEENVLNFEKHKFDFRRHFGKNSKSHH